MTIEEAEKEIERFKKEATVIFVSCAKCWLAKKITTIEPEEWTEERMKDYVCPACLETERRQKSIAW